MKTKLSRSVAVLCVVLLCFIYLGVLPVNSQEEDTWTDLVPMQKARLGLGVVALNGKIYAIGGSDGSWDGYLDINEEYDPKTNTWTTKAPIPERIAYFGITTYNGKIYCVSSSTGSTYAYNPTNNTWEKKASLPNPRYEITACTVNDKIYVMGGTSKCLDVYNPSNNSWTAKAFMIHANGTISQEHVSVVLNGKIHVIGGYPIEYSHQIYDPKIDSWSIGEPLLRGYYYAVAAATTGVNAPKRIYVFGGNQSYKNDNTWKCGLVSQSYDPLTKSWSLVSQIPIGHLIGDATTINDELYIIGGAESESTRYALVLPSLCRLYTPIDYGIPDPTPSPKPEPFPTTQVLVIIITLIVGLGILTYFKKYRK